MDNSNHHIGSSFDDFLREEGLYDEAEEHARQEVEAWKQRQVTPVSRPGRGLGLAILWSILVVSLIMEGAYVYLYTVAKVRVPLLEFVASLIGLGASTCIAMAILSLIQEAGNSQALRWILTAGWLVSALILTHAAMDGLYGMYN